MESEHNTSSNSIATKLIEIENDVKTIRLDIEEFIISGEYKLAKERLINLVLNLQEMYDKIEEMENEEDCDCIENISEKEFEAFLVNIGGLESGYFDRYWGNNKARKFLFKISNWILNNVFFIRSKNLRNPFRSVIDKPEFLSVGPGWYGLLKKLIEESIAAGWNKELCQSKEKFGGLRFYINEAPKEVYDIIHKYERLSFEICETCGSAGKPRPGGWIKTLCDSCYKPK